MAQVPEFKVGCNTNQIKVIAASDWPSILGADGAFASGEASYISDGYTLTLGSDRDIMIIDGNDKFDVEFTSADSLGYPLGMRIPIGFTSVEIKNVTSNVKILRLNYQTMNTRIRDAYTDSNSVTAAQYDLLYPGDIIVAYAEESYNFQLEYSFDPSLRYSQTGFDVIALSNANPV